MRSSSLVLAALALAAFGCATERSQSTTPPAAPTPAPAAVATTAPAPEPKPATLPLDGATLATGTPAELTQGCQAAMTEGQRRIDALKARAPGGDVHAALDDFDEGLAALSDIGAKASVIRNANPDQAMRDAAERCEQDVSKLLTDITLDRGVYDALAALKLDGQDAPTRKWVTDTLADFRRAGVDKDEPTRAKVKALNDELVKIGQQFSNNIAHDVRTVSFAPADLDGLPADWIRAHPAGADGKVKVTTDYPDYNPFLTYAKSTKAREALWRAFRMRGYPANEPVLKQMLQKRFELANLLGYPTWAALVTEDKMIKTEKNAADFIEKITQASADRMKRDFDQLLARKRKDDKKAKLVLPWDQFFYEDRIRSEQYAFDSQAVRPFFEYGKVKQGLFDITSKMFGVTYKRVEGAKVWHPDVEAWDVLDGEGPTQRVLGRFYLDMHPRADKYKHAAQFTLVTGKQGVRLPEAVLMCNFPKPGAEPALMLHDDVGTFFHEFGHLLHHIFAGNLPWAGISGTSMEWDFVEAPSQMLEEWTWDPEVLGTFARHYQTGAPIPAELVKQMKAAEDFGRGLWVRQQMFYAATSLNFHNRDPKTLDPVKMVKDLQARYTPFQYVPGTYFHLSFGHLEGYSAIYYTYMWSLVIAKDMFTRFTSEGLLNPAPARDYRQKVLEQGGADEAGNLVKAFLGRPYDFAAYQTWLNKG